MKHIEHARSVSPGNTNDVSDVSDDGDDIDGNTGNDSTIISSPILR